MNKLLSLYRGGVEAWECDQMRHMNVQFYMSKASDAFAHLQNTLGLSPALIRSTRKGLRFKTIRTQYKSEVHVGTPLYGLGGVRLQLARGPGRAWVGGLGGWVQSGEPVQPAVTTAHACLQTTVTNQVSHGDFLSQHRRVVDRQGVAHGSKPNIFGHLGERTKQGQWVCRGRKRLKKVMFQGHEHVVPQLIGTTAMQQGFVQPTLIVIALINLNFRVDAEVHFFTQNFFLGLMIRVMAITHH
jgi:acyl-CoA thioesterase FadM